MDLHLEMSDSEARIHARVSLTMRGEAFRFALASPLKIESARCGGRELPLPEGEDCALQYLPTDVRAYTFAGYPGAELEFEYSGALSGPLLYYRREVRHFSLYNCWYPVAFDAEAEPVDVTLPDGGEWELVQGERDAERGLWRYTTRGRTIKDCNILLLRRGEWTRLESGGVSVLYCEPSRAAAAAEEAVRQCSDIRAFYRSLYGHDGELRDLTLIYLPEGPDKAAYMRDGLIVFMYIPGDIRHILAHELGHAHACRADFGSWEDWLNEAGAEWSALLYEREVDPEGFEQRLEVLLKIAGSHSLRLRPEDGSHPDDVHETGVLLFAKICEKYGPDAVRRILLSLDSLGRQDTAGLLAELRRRGDEELTREIEAHIDA